jgi:hypothetical protein
LLRIARPLVFVLLGLGIAGAIVATIWIAVTRGEVPPAHDLRTMSAFRRGLLVFAHSELGSSALAALPVAAIGAGVLAWYARTQRWPFAVIAGVAVIAIAGVWALQDLVASAEPASYRARSPYVRGATGVAYGGTLYFAALAAAAGATFVLSRRTSGLPPTGAPGTMNSGGIV